MRDYSVVKRNVCLMITLLCVVASHPPFLRSKNTLWASEPPYWSEMVFPIISYMDMKMKERLLSVAVRQHLQFVIVMMR